MGLCDSKSCAAISDKVVGIADKIGRDRRNLIPILHAVQKEMGYVSEDAMEALAETLDMPVSAVHGTATFYTLFYTKPQGKYVVRLCDSPPCHIEGSRAVRQAVSKTLGISEGETSGDGTFSFEIVSCMGLCGVAPAMMVNDDVYGNLTPDAVPGILGKYKEAGAGAAGVSGNCYRNKKEGR